MITISLSPLLDLVSYKLLDIYCSIFRTSLAGLPATIALSGTSFVTVESAATIELAPIVIPGKIVAFAPIHAFLSL